MVKRSKSMRWFLLLLSASAVWVTAGVNERTLTRDQVQLRGNFTPGGLILGKSLPSVSVDLNGKPIKVSPQGDFVFGFGRDAHGEHRLGVALNAERLTIQIQLMPREYNIQRIDGVPQRTVDPPKPDVLARIRKETSLVRTARARFEPELHFLNEFVWPIKGVITGVYGSQRVYNGEPRRPHYGVDLAAAEGTPVRAPNHGVVTLTHDDMFFSGGTLIIDHGYGVSSTFLHLKEILVQPGDQVKQGDQIALVGSTGRSTGAHLDWRINWFKVRIDPAQIVSVSALE